MTKEQLKEEFYRYLKEKNEKIPPREQDTEVMIAVVLDFFIEKLADLSKRVDFIGMTNAQDCPYRHGHNFIPPVTCGCKTGERLS